jgi:hypothetical protein
MFCRLPESICFKDAAFTIFMHTQQVSCS